MPWKSGTAGCCLKSLSRAEQKRTGTRPKVACEVLRRRKAEEELATVQRQIETQPHNAAGSSEELRRLLTRKQELRRRLQELPS